MMRHSCWGQTTWDLSAFFRGFLNSCPDWLFSALAQPLPYAYGVPVLQPRVAVPRPLPWGPRPAKRFNPNGVAPHTPFSHPPRPEPLCGSIVAPLIPRVGLIPFGRPWAGGRKPFGLGGRAPIRSLPSWSCWGQVEMALTYGLFGTFCPLTWATGHSCWGQTTWDLSAFFLRVSQ